MFKSMLFELHFQIMAYLAIMFIVFVPVSYVNSKSKRNRMIALLNKNVSMLNVTE